MPFIVFITDIIKWGCIYYWNHEYYWNNVPLHYVMYKVVQLINIYNRRHPTRQINPELWYIDNYIPYHTIQEIKDIHMSNGYFRTLCIQHGINERILLLIERLNERVSLFIEQLNETRTTNRGNLIIRYTKTKTTHHNYVIKPIHRRSAN
jgi:hypothetical protein